VSGFENDIHKGSTCYSHNKVAKQQVSIYLFYEATGDKQCRMSHLQQRDSFDVTRSQPRLSKATLKALERKKKAQYPSSYKPTGYFIGL